MVMDESAMKWVPWEKILDMLDKKQNRKERETLETIRHNKFTIYPLNSVKYVHTPQECFEPSCARPTVTGIGLAHAQL